MMLHDDPDIVEADILLFPIVIHELCDPCHQYAQLTASVSSEDSCQTEGAHSAGINNEARQELGG